MPKPLTYDNAVEELLKRVPAFAADRLQDESSLSHDDPRPYLVFGDFARFLINIITLRAIESDELLSDSFALLGEMATSADDEIVNLAETAVFEVLGDSPKTVAAAREHLPTNALAVFERVVNLCSS